jgi:antirestriction protein
MDAMKIYVACLAAYNNGWLHGKWIDCTGKDLETLQEEVSKMLKESPVTKEYGEIAEEWAIHDFEGFCNYKIEEGTRLEEIAQLVEAVKNSNYDLELITGVMDHMGHGIDHAIEYINDNYVGEFTDLYEYAWSFLEESEGFNQIPKHLQGYFDMQAYVRDLEYNCDVFTVDAPNGNIYVLWNH